MYLLITKTIRHWESGAAMNDLNNKQQTPHQNCKKSQAIPRSGLGDPVLGYPYGTGTIRNEMLGDGLCDQHESHLIYFK